MSETFLSKISQIKQDREELDKRTKDVKSEAVAYIQQIIDTFGIQAGELHFSDATVEAVKSRKHRVPAAIKYRLPNGVEWTGKGIMKKEVREYLEENNLTRADLDQFLTEHYR